MIQAYNTAMQKASLVAQIQTERWNLENTLLKLNTKQLDLPDAVGIWSVKDTLAHIAAWQQRLIDWLTAYTAGIDPQSPPPYGLADEPLNRLNYQIYRENRERKFSTVLSNFRSIYQRTLVTVKKSPEELLNQTINLSEHEALQVWQIIAANTFEHDQEHRENILTWINAQ